MRPVHPPGPCIFKGSAHSGTIQDLMRLECFSTPEHILSKQGGQIYRIDHTVQKPIWITSLNTVHLRPAALDLTLPSAYQSFRIKTPPPPPPTPSNTSRITTDQPSSDTSLDSDDFATIVTPPRRGTNVRKCLFSQDQQEVANRKSPKKLRNHLAPYTTKTAATGGTVIVKRRASF